MTNKIIEEDLQYIFNNLNNKQKKFLENSNILITGCGGFLGFYFLNFFLKFRYEFNIESITALDNFIVGKPKWYDLVIKGYENFLAMVNFDIAKDSIEVIEKAKKADIIIHMASIASPTFYRKYPIETLDANVWGLRKLLDFYIDKPIKGLLFFSSSEVYGDPFQEYIPTDEEYRGNVATIGPRACYDEAKRFGETLSYLYSSKYDIPVRIARPFNNYGPGMKLDDRRAPADFAKSILEEKDIHIYSDGTPTRTFCYIADAITGYLKVISHDNFDYFNIGIDKPEISIKELSGIYLKNAEIVFGKKLNANFTVPPDSEYLKHNPNRRCPVIDKARNILEYNPRIFVEEGVYKFLEFLKYEKEDGLI